MIKTSFTAVCLILLTCAPITASPERIEKKILHCLASDSALLKSADRRCRQDDRYVVYLIDNFEQKIELVPEVETTHGDLMRRILISGRDDIQVKVLNTSLTRGLAQAIDDILHGSCADAVISSIPGSNYTYGQVGSLLPGARIVGTDTILAFRDELRQMLKSIACEGFPSVDWLENIDVNANKLTNDARKLFFADALGKLRIPLLIPYGNDDASYRSESRTVNLLSLSPDVLSFSALDRMGQRISGFPYSPLSHSDEKADYHILELPDPDNPVMAHLDINDDGFGDYTFRRSGPIPYRDRSGLLAFAPPAATDATVEALKRLTAATGPEAEALVLTASQYRSLACRYETGPEINSDFVWISPPFQEGPFFFNAVPWVRGVLRGTSLIPPNKVKEMLSLIR